ncbi:MAG TPA: DUF58 domain-containing protein [Rhizomicrobium sp.]|jgi:uncharacterized protein (DUF58 family)
MYPTRRMIFVVLLGVPLSMLAAVLSPPLWMIGLGWIFFAACLFILDAVLVANPSRLSYAIAAPHTMGVARRETGHVTFEFAGQAPSELELAFDADGRRIAIEPDRQTLPVTKRQARADFTMVPLRRGEGGIENLWARWQGPLGLVWKQRVDGVRDKIAVLPNIGAIKDEAMRLFQRDSGSFGLRVRLRAGEGAEFNALKEFQSGMDRRTIDWKQTARHGKLLAREFQAEENQRIVFALDTGRLMCEPLAGLPRIDRAIQALLLLSYVALRLGDRVGLFAFDEKPNLSSGAVSGANAFGVLQRLAAKIDYTTKETNFTLGLTQLAGELDQRAIIVIFTDFSDTTGAELMLENIKRLVARHVVLFVVFRDEELESMVRHAPTEPADVSRAVIADAMLRERGLVTTRLRRMGVDVIDASADKIGAGLIDAYLAVKQGRS